MHWSVHSLFSGIECCHEALDILNGAVAKHFGFQLDLKYALMATGFRIMSNDISLKLTYKNTCSFSCNWPRLKRIGFAVLTSENTSMTLA